jgi:hypothetical protein
MNTPWLKAFSQDLLVSITAAIVGAIVIGIVVISADLRYFGDKSAVLIPLFVGMPLGAAPIPGMRSTERSLLRRLLAFLFAAICASAGIIGIVAAMDLFGSWCAFLAPLTAGTLSCAASRILAVK